MKKFNILFSLLLLGAFWAPALTLAESPVILRFKLGDKGDEVRQLQEKLRASGDFLYPEITGYYGKITDDAVKKYELRTEQKIIKPIPRPLPMPPVWNNNGITVLSPNGGEVWMSGETYKISYTNVPKQYQYTNCTENIPGGCELDLHVYLDQFHSKGSPKFGGTNNVRLIASSQGYPQVAGLEGFSFVVPAWTAGTDDVYRYPYLYKIRVCVTGQCDSSDGFFTIYSGDTVPYPRPEGNRPPVIHGVFGPTVLRVGETGEWSVKASDPESGNLSYQMFWGDEENESHANGAMSPGATEFRQTGTFSHAYSVAGVYNPVFYVSDDAGNSAKSSMTVQVGGGVPRPVPNGFMQVVSPNGGENWPVGSNQSVQWVWSGPNSNPSVDSTNLNLYLFDGNSKWSLGRGVDSRNGVGYQITVPRVPTGAYKISICDNYIPNTTGVCDQSDSYFKIYSDETITIDPIMNEDAAGAASVKVVSTSGKTVTGAKVSLHTTNGRLVGTDNTSSGFALFENLPYGSYLAYAKADGYAPARAKVSISEKKPKADVTVKLKKEKTVDMPKVITTGIVSSNPPDGAIDARMPSNVDGSGFWQGWFQFDLKMAGVNTSALMPNDFVLKTTGGVSTTINNLLHHDDGSVTLVTQYGVPIPEGERTVIRHKPTGTEICLGYLPGDVDGSANVDGVDLLALIDVINGVKTLPSYSTDLNRDGVTNNEDQLTWIDLTSGADAYSEWFGQSLPKCPKV